MPTYDDRAIKTELAISYDTYVYDTYIYIYTYIYTYIYIYTYVYDTYV